jgi:hypothetical protein
LAHEPGIHNPRRVTWSHVHRTRVACGLWIPGSARFARGPGMTEPVDWFNQINSMESMVWLVEKTWMAVTSTAMTTLKSER